MASVPTFARRAPTARSRRPPDSALPPLNATNYTNATNATFDPIAHCEAEWWALVAANATRINETNVTSNATVVPPPLPPPPPPTLRLPSYLWVCMLELWHGATAIRMPDGAEYLRLTSGKNSLGTAWYESMYFLRGGFWSTFTFRSSGHVDGCADGVGAAGLAFVVHDDPRRTMAVGCAGPGLGFASDLSYASTCARHIDQSLAVSLQTHDNASLVDVSAAGIAALSVASDSRGNSSEMLRAAVLGHRLADGHVHTARVEYIPNAGGRLTLFIDDMDAPVFAVHVDAAEVLDDDGYGYVGFTASSGAVHVEHEILSWEMDALPPDDRGRQRHRTHASGATEYEGVV